MIVFVVKYGGLRLFSCNWIFYFYVDMLTKTLGIPFECPENIGKKKVSNFL